MAEGVGFEPTKVSLAGFQDRCTRPLCEPSVENLTGFGAPEAKRESLFGKFEQRLDHLSNAIVFHWLSQKLSIFRCIGVTTPDCP